MLWLTLQYILIWHQIRKLGNIQCNYSYIIAIFLLLNFIIQVMISSQKTNDTSPIFHFTEKSEKLVKIYDVFDLIIHFG